MSRISVFRRSAMFVSVLALLASPELFAGPRESAVAGVAAASTPISRATRAKWPAPPPPQFAQPTTLATSPGNQQAVAADFNGDGKMDLAVTVATGVDILLGNGDGTFQPAVTYLVKNGCSGIVAADMNNDGRLDLVTTRDVSGQVNILLGNGDGTFQAPKSFAVGNGAHSLAVGDFNGDGNLDVVVSQNGFYVGVLLGNGKGALRQVFNWPVTGPRPASDVAVGDFNGDGKLDIVVADGNVNLLLGNGDGTFQAPTKFAKGSNATQLQVADMNNDGLLDVVINQVNTSGQHIGVLLGAGNGTFGSPKLSSVVPISNFKLGDFNGDGKLDVIGGLTILLGNGNGTLQAPLQTYNAQNYGASTLAADLNSDGKLDVVLTQFSPESSLLLVFGNGDGTLQVPRTFVAEDAGSLNDTAILAMGDFNNDGKTDMAVLNFNLAQGFSPPMINILLGNGDGTFQAPLPGFSAVGTQAMVAADLNQDGKVDLVVLNNTPGADGQALIFLGNGDGTFQAPMTFTTGFDSVALAVRDFNKDGKLDLAVLAQCINSINCQNGQVGILLGNGDGTFGAPTGFNVGLTPNSLVLADFNSDGKVDLAVANTGGGGNPGNVSILLGNGDGTFKTAATVNTGVAPFAMVAADFNNDHKQDLVVKSGGQYPLNLEVLLGNGDGTFKAGILTSIGVSGLAIIVPNDFNGDGKVDLALANNGVDIYTGNGDGTFQPALTFLQGTSASAIKATDLDGDVLPDLVLGTNATNTITVLRNVTGGP